MAKQGAAVTVEKLEAIVKLLNLVMGHAVRLASDAKTGTIAVRNLLVAKGAISEVIV